MLSISANDRDLDNVDGDDVADEDSDQEIVWLMLELFTSIYSREFIQRLKSRFTIKIKIDEILFFVIIFVLFQ